MILTIMVVVSLILPAQVYAKTPEIMSALRSHIQVYGPITSGYRSGSESYSAKISYNKKTKKFLFQCTYTNGRSTSSVKMYMPASKKLTSYTVYFNETVRASGKTAKISGKAKLKRKNYSNQYTNLIFSRKNKTSVSKKIKNNAYQTAANSLLRCAFYYWEKGLETNTTLCFRNFGFDRITVINSLYNSGEWK